MDCYVDSTATVVIIRSIVDLEDFVMIARAPCARNDGANMLFSCGKESKHFYVEDLLLYYSTIHFLF